jgi:MSHA pilin protein MshD
MFGSRCRGLTLVELVISMVIVSIAVAGVTLAFNQSIRGSADPMVDAQALAIAEAYMDEILAKPVADPSGAPGCSAGGPNRSDCAKLGDYHGIDQVPTDQFGSVIPGLAAYRVRVTVGSENVGGVGLSVVAVSVSHEPGGLPSGRSVLLRSHKVDY